MLVGPFDFADIAKSIPASQIVPYEQWDKLSPACNSIGILPPKLANDLVLSTHTIAIVSSSNNVKWYHSSVQYPSKVLESNRR